MRNRLIELLRKADDATEVHDCDYPTYEKAMQAFYTSIADYLLANGVIVLPCAVGDTVWCIYEKKIYKGKVTVIKPFIIEKGELLYINMNVSFEMKDPFYGDGRTLTHEMYGRYLENVFLTKEEAESELKELEGDKK